MSDSQKLYSSLKAIHSALDDALGDGDVTHIEDDDELRSECPAQWAAQKLAELIAADSSPSAAGEWIDQNHQIDRYGVALMMIREGCSDPSGLARRVLSEFEKPR